VWDNRWNNSWGGWLALVNGDGAVYALEDEAREVSRTAKRRYSRLSGGNGGNSGENSENVELHFGGSC